jgi:hypothetical protein
VEGHCLPLPSCPSQSLHTSASFYCNHTFSSLQAQPNSRSGEPSTAVQECVPAEANGGAIYAFTAYMQTIDCVFGC